MYFKAALGLGNPGSKYKNTYHNVGHLMIDFLSEKNIFPERVIIAKNDSYMNKSGNSALKIFKKIGRQPEELLVIHDDSDIDIGKYKLSINRSSAGHKGVQDIINKIGTKKFWRLRIGVRPPSQTIADSIQDKIPRESASSQRKSAPRMKAEEFVLKKIKKEDMNILQNVFEQSAKLLVS